jgi:hypothetical protein
MATTTDAPVTLDLLYKELKGLRKDVRKIRQFIGDPTGEKAAERAKTNGFNKPQKVTPELQKFLGLAADEQISRSQVTKRLNAYVAERGLKAGQLINLDATLKALLNPPEGEQVTFLNLQKYISPHYIKEPAAPKEKKPAKEPAAKPAATTEAPKEKKVRPKVVKST